MSEQTLALAKRIKLLILDVDGILSDGKLYYDNHGNEMKSFCTQDGQGIKTLQKHSDVRVAIITGRKSEIVARRAKELGIELVIQGREDKWQALQEVFDQLHLKPEEIAHMGDDWPDLSIMTRVGLALTVPNAHASVAEYAHWISHRSGGDGAVREACDLILQAQGHYTNAMAQHLPQGSL
ncbi:HAD hydrolase family protein [Gilvimarinus sp. SDUM040013]|uniref:3-deoxy-D-manno-octulosonate 8-phosphate phosphatase KdsC n=1 Tax=Gilvimarinus gilvus TaxID=3058038 RepID=A0ABU4RW58_9GAMM|nr:HAD hydrolase family protein [Gilvimarinus sp. SDUM040013]MDO3388348.1 HAD hydrolase family protein [Gilvimarinus sp. SDUM040013]MDX6847898.1 HAD hydrolase family protein [Gilvimarinus sp. SDUM040013]